MCRNSMKMSYWVKLNVPHEHLRRSVEGVLIMNDKERQRKAICEMVRQNKISLKQASEQCGVCYDQMLRIYKKYILEGDAGLIHGNRGRVSNRKHSNHQEIINTYLEKYEGFGPTLAAEYLLQDGYQVNHETLRKWLIQEGLWNKQRKRSVYRQRRERKAQFGELVQIDGSIHDWFSEGKHTCLLNMVDDATGITLARLAEGETTRVVFETLKAWIEKYGIPLALYVDLKNVYIGPKELSLVISWVFESSKRILLKPKVVWREIMQFISTVL